MNDIASLLCKPPGGARVARSWGEWYRKLAVQAARGRKGRKELGVNGIASLLCKPPGGARVAKGWGEWYRKLAVQAARGRKGRKELG